MRTLALALVLGLSGPAAVPSAGRGGETHRVLIEGMRFEPQELTVAVGDTVIWINRDLVPHTATSEAGGFDSKTLQPAESWKYTAQDEGAFPYVCSLHPTMTATLHVE